MKHPTSKKELKIHQLIKPLNTPINTPIHSLYATLVLLVFIGCILISSGYLHHRSYTTPPPLWLWITSAAIQGNCHLQFIILYHDIVHGACIKWERQFLPILYGLLTPFSPTQYQRWHLDHHRYYIGNEKQRDPKRSHLSPKINTRWYKLLYFSPLLAAIYGKAAKGAERDHQYSDSLRDQIKRERIRTFGLHVMVMFGLLYKDPRLWLRLHFVPLGIFFPIAFGMNRIGQHYHFVNYKHKEEDIPDSSLLQALHSGSRVDGNVFWQIISLNSHYHLEHHMFPTVPFYKLHHVNRLLRPIYEEYNIRNFGYGQLLYMWFVLNMKPHQVGEEWHPNILIIPQTMKVCFKIC